jgi:hypothetical protein
MTMMALIITSAMGRNPHRCKRMRSGLRNGLVAGVLQHCCSDLLVRLDGSSSVRQIAASKEGKATE